VLSGLFDSSLPKHALVLVQKEEKEAGSCVTGWRLSLPVTMENDPLALTKPVCPQRPGNHTRSHPSLGYWTWKTLQRRVERNAVTQRLIRKMVRYC